MYQNELKCKYYQCVRLFLLISLGLYLTACTTPKPRFSTGAEPKVIENGAYKSANLRPYSVKGKSYTPFIPKRGHTETGTASWYGHESGSLTATGEAFTPEGISAAHKTWALPSVVEVTNLDNGRSLKLRLNDRGPFVGDRIIDLSHGAAKALGTLETGTAKVRIKFLGPAGTNAISSYNGKTNTPPDDQAVDYRIQVGAFSNRDNAYDIAQSIGGKIDRRRGLFIVFTGPYEGVERAENERQKLISKGYFDSVLVQDGKK
jgi:rare lipoprotein A